MKRWKMMIGAAIFIGLATTVYIGMNKPAYCNKSWIQLRESQVTQVGVLPVITSKQIESILGTVSEGNYAVYGDFSSCWLLKTFDGYHAVFSTFYDNEHQTFQISAFLADKYKIEYQNLLKQQVERNEYLVIQEDLIFWRKNDVYYLITGQSDVIDAFVEARIYE